MSLHFNGTTISRVGVVDDVADLRSTLATELSLIDLEPDVYVGPFPTLNDLVETVMRQDTAVVCDHQFSNNYAPETGAKAVAAWYHKGFPALLTTAYEQPRILEIRRYLPFIPVLLDTSKMDPDLIIKGFEICVNEFKGNFASFRKPWQTLVRIVNVEGEEGNSIVDVVVPAWNSLKIIQLPAEIFPSELHKYLVAGERFFAKVNIGAESYNELYFTDFEYRGGLD